MFMICDHKLTTQYWIDLFYVSSVSILCLCVCVDKNSGIETEADIENLVSEWVSEWTVGNFVFPAISTCSKLIDCVECGAQGDQSDVSSVSWQLLLSLYSVHRCWTRGVRFFLPLLKLTLKTHKFSHERTHTCEHTSWSIFGSGKWQQSSSHWKYTLI